MCIICPTSTQTTVQSACIELEECTRYSAQEYVYRNTVLECIWPWLPVSIHMPLSLMHPYKMPCHVPTLTGKAIPDSRGIAAEGHDPPEIPLTSPMSTTDFRHLKPLHSMISLPEWSQIRMNDSHENQSMSKVYHGYHDQSGIIRCYKLQRIYIHQSWVIRSVLAPAPRGVPKRAIQGSVARVGGICGGCPSKLATMFFRWHLGCTKDVPVEEGIIEWLRAWFQMLNVYKCVMCCNFGKMFWNLNDIIDWRQDRTI